MLLSKMNMEDWANEDIGQSKEEEERKTSRENRDSAASNLWSQFDDLLSPTTHYHHHQQPPPAEAGSYPPAQYAASAQSPGEAHYNSSRQPYNPFYPDASDKPQAEGDEDDRKPAARTHGDDDEKQSPLDASQRTNKRHSISNDPYVSPNLSNLTDTYSDYEDDDPLRAAAKRPRMGEGESMPYPSHPGQDFSWGANYDPAVPTQLAFASPPPVFASPPVPPVNYTFDDSMLAQPMAGAHPPPPPPVHRPAVLPSPVHQPVAPPELPPRPRRSIRARRQQEPAPLRLQTSSGERTSQVRRGPTQRELEEATTPRARNALQTWYERLNDLWEYKKRHGDCNVPQKYPENTALGIWVNKQRMEKKFMDEGLRTSMTADKLQALEEMGFKWAKRKGQHSWDEKYEELLRYKERHGNADPPTKYADNPALGRWVSTQRSQYKQFREGMQTHMTQQRVDMLNRIGFKWNMMEADSR